MFFKGKKNILFCLIVFHRSMLFVYFYCYLSDNQMFGYILIETQNFCFDNAFFLSLLPKFLKTNKCMKRTIIFISLFALVLSASAQFKVLSDGKIAINGNGSSSYQMHCGNTSGGSGLYFSATGNSSHVSVHGGYFSASATAQAIGLRGYGNNATTSIGVMV